MTSDDRFTRIFPCLLAVLTLAACGGGSNRQQPPPPPPDTTAPTVGDVQAGAQTTVNRTVSLTVDASDNVGVTTVRFFVDGTEIGADTTAPYGIDWDTSSVADGDHTLRADAEDAAGNVGQSADVTVTVANSVQFDVTMSGNEEVPAVESDGSGSALLTVDLVSGAIEGELNIEGIDVGAAHIHEAFAGNNGPVLIGLEQDATDPATYRVPASTTLDDDGINALLAAGLYVNAHTAENPGGELRGQILPDGFVLSFTELSGGNEPQPVDSIGSGRAAVTIDQASGATVVEARVENLAEANAAHLHDAYAGSNGPVLVELLQDSTEPARWFAADAELNAAGLDAFAAGRTYVNVHTPANPGGEIRGQVIPDGIRLLVTDLSGSEEVPAVDTPAAGRGFLTHDVAADLVTIHVNVRRLDDASAAHLHEGFGGSNGGVAIGLMQDGSDPAHWFAELESLSTDQRAALDAGATYLNVHSPDHPGGEVRGQLIPDGISFALGSLEGRQEVPAVDSTAGGSFAVTVNPAALTLTAHVNTTGADDATAAHLHDAYAGDSGGVAIGLDQDPADLTRWSATDVTLTGDQLDAFSAGRFYVNVHTPANPGGEVRGQVAPPPVEVVFTDLSGDQEVPAVASAASGLAASTVNLETGSLTLHLRTSGADNASAAHLHEGFAGSNGGVLVGLDQDGGDDAHWFVTEAVLDAAALADYRDGRSYVNLHTPANPGGEIRGQVVPQDILVLFTAMDGDQVVPPVTTAAQGTLATTANTKTRRVVANANTTGVDDATSAGIHNAPAGQNGPEVLPLAETGTGVWSAETEPLEADAWFAFRAGELYAQVATPAEADGEIRGQIVPPDAADFDGTAPTVEITAPAASATVDGTIAVEATADDNLGVTAVRFLADGVLIDSDGEAPYSVEWDTTDSANGDVVLTAEASDAAGNVGTSEEVTVTVANAAPVTLAEIQAEVFTPSCAGCHSGPTGNTLPAGMDLSSTSASHAALVGVTSLQVGSLERVTPGNPDDSYLIQKLEGTNAVGTRMPQGGPFLDQATIDRIRDWISDGAPET